MNLGKLRELALRYAQLRTGAEKQPLPTRAIPQLPPGANPAMPAPTMRFRPGVQLDPSQVEDRRGAYRIAPGGYRVIDGMPTMPGGRAGEGGEGQYDEGFTALEQMAQRYDAVRTARNKRSTGVGVNKNGKQRRRY